MLEGIAVTHAGAPTCLIVAARQIERTNGSLQRCVTDNYPIFASTSAATRFLDLQGKAHALNDAITATEAAVAAASEFRKPPQEAQPAQRGRTWAGVLDEDAVLSTNHSRGNVPLGRARSSSTATPGGDDDNDSAAGAGTGAGSVAAKSQSGMLSADMVKNFAKKAKRATMALISREKQEAAQQVAVRKLHEQFGVGFDAKLTRSPSGPGAGSRASRVSSLSPARSRAGSSMADFSSPRQRMTVTQGLSSRHRLTRLGSPLTGTPTTVAAPAKVRGTT